VYQNETNLHKSAVPAKSADKPVVDKDKYQIVEIPIGGQFRLVPEADFEAASGPKSPPNQIIIKVSAVPTVGLLVRLFRVSLGLTVEELAQEIGIKKRQVINIEGNKAIPRRSTIHALAVLFGSEFERQVLQIL
jgi:DNA-binding XRE family transcriptional regulator